MFLKIRNVRAHVFFSDKDTLPAFVDNSFLASRASGIPNTFMGLVEENLKSTRKPYLPMMVDIMGTRVGDIASADDVYQLVNYSKWVAGRLAGGEIETVQPILIAHDFSEEAITKARNSDFNDRGIRFIKNRVEANDLVFDSLDI